MNKLKTMTHKDVDYKLVKSKFYSCSGCAFYSDDLDCNGSEYAANLCGVTYEYPKGGTWKPVIVLKAQENKV